MKVLLDTHAFLWWVMDDSQLSNMARATIAEPSNVIYFSVVSAWEIIIKERTGKLSLPAPPATYIPSRLVSNRFISLEVKMQHVLQIASLPDRHRDPFDLSVRAFFRTGLFSGRVANWRGRHFARR